MPAKSLDSYKETLYALLDEFKPKSVLEWGPGLSTEILALYPSILSVRSIEHDRDFYERAMDKGLLNSEIILQEDMEKYPKEHLGRFYDLIFVDGRNRSLCLEEASQISSVVILHDAARGDYRPAIEKFKFRLWTDSGNTVTLTNNEETFKRISYALKTLSCEIPSEEKISLSLAGELKETIV